MAERMVETLTELPFIGDQADPLSLSHPPDTAAKAMLRLETRSPVQQPHAPLYCPYYSHREAIRSDPNTAPGTERHRLRPMAEIDARRGYGPLARRACAMVSPP